MPPTTINFTGPANPVRDVAALVLLVVGVLTMLLHLFLAVRIMDDGLALQSKRRPLMFFGPVAWCITVLLTGLFGVVAYWLMHHSSLCVAVPPGLPDREKVNQ